jgi:Xaa-Pro aminopeptidase
MDKRLSENVFLPVSDEEQNRRWSAVRQEMKKQNIDCLVMQNSEAHMGGYVRWFIDMPAKFGTPATVLFPAEDEMTVITEGNTPELVLPDWMMRGIKENIVRPYYRSIHYTDSLDGQAAVEAIRKNGYKKIGIIAKGLMSACFYEYLKENLTELEFVDTTDLVDEIKCVKSTEEISLIRRTADITGAAFAAIPAMLRPGRKEYEVANEIRHILTDMGSEEQLIMVCSAPMGQQAAHKMPFFMNRTLQKGDQVMVMLEVSGPGGFYQEVGRTFCIGEPSKELQDGWNAARDAQRRAAEILKEGACPADICRINDSYMEQRGFPSRGMIFAHGQGYELAERPVIYGPETIAIRSNMNIAVHPFGITDSVYVFCCDNFLTGPDGAEPLSKVPLELMIAGTGPWY